jgi:hypothetical protein
MSTDFLCLFDIFVTVTRGVDKFYKTHAKLASSLAFSLAKSENNNWPIILKVSVRGEKTIARLTSGFVILLANPEFYSHLASGYPHPCSNTVVLDGRSLALGVYFFSYASVTL